MALKVCNECKKEYSSTADSCPHCGANKKRKSLGCGGVILVLFLILFVLFKIGSCDLEKEKEIKKEVIYEEKRQKIAYDKKIYDDKQSSLKKEEEKFKSNIESNYSLILDLFNKKEYQQCLDKIEIFKSFDFLDYKNTMELYKTSMIEKLKTIPSSEFRENLKFYRSLMVLDPTNETYKSKSEYYEKKLDLVLEKEKKEKEYKEYKESCDLELVSSSWSNSEYHSTYTGFVKNISGIPLNNVVAVVTWEDKNGTMITYDTALIEYRPILPNQTSPFSVIETYNPAMNTASVSFKYHMGGEINTYYKPK